MPPELEQKLRAVAQQMKYPPTPRIEVPLQVSKPRLVRRYTWQLMLLALISLAIFMVGQPVRATVRDWLGLGGLRIVSSTQAPPADIALIEAVTRSRQTTLAEAKAQTPFSLRYPTELGLPDEVYLHKEHSNHGVVMVWRDPEQRIEYALYQLSNSEGFYKGADFIRVTEIKESEFALWLEQPHIFWFSGENGQDSQQAYLIEKPVLVWEYRGILYRFESNLTLEAAIIVANSMTTIE